MNYRFWNLSQRIAITAVLCGLVGMGSAWAGQNATGWVPFSAIQVGTTYDISGSQKKLIGERVGSYLRNQEGSVYNQTVTVIGPPGPGLDEPAVLQDGKTGVTYRINYRSRKAEVIRAPAEGSSSTLSPPTADSFKGGRSREFYLGTKMINGIECEGWRFRPSKDGILVGEEWVAPSLNFKPIVTRIVNSRDHLEFDFTLQNIQVGIVSNPNAFKVPRAFILMR